jgi:rare lipoprotein A
MGIMMNVPICIAKPNIMRASWYKDGHTTANGEKFKPHGLTAAHKTLPFDTKLRVTYEGKSVIVRINDRGPFIPGRQLDLSFGAARKIGCVDDGVCIVHYEIIRKKK